MDANVKAGQNPEELFDVVDERDAVIGRAPRREVHAKNLLHRAIHVLVFDKHGRIYLQKRSMAKDSAPGAWCSSCSGHLDAGEDYDTAAVRELREEIGVDIKEPPMRWLRLRPCAETGWEFVWIYRLDHEGPFTLDPAEVERGEWFLIAQVNQGVIERPSEYAESFRYFWPRVAMELEG